MPNTKLSRCNVDDSQKFYSIVDDEWSMFWTFNHVAAPRVKSSFLSYLEDKLGITDDSDDLKFMSVTRKVYPVGDDYIEFKPFIRYMIVRFIEDNTRYDK